MVSQALEASADLTDFSHIAMLVQKIEVNHIHFHKAALKKNMVVSNVRGPYSPESGFAVSFCRYYCKSLH